MMPEKQVNQVLHELTLISVFSAGVNYQKTDAL
jgi:hypothetical protein